jgi:hypothetical protein
MDLWVWIVFGIVFLAGYAARLWFYRRWLSNGISPTRAALYTIPIAYVPLIALLVIASLMGRGPGGVGEWAMIIAAIGLPALFGFGLRRAVFEYAERQGVRAEVKRLRR